MGLRWLDEQGVAYWYSIEDRPWGIRYCSSNLVGLTLESLREQYQEPFEAFGFKWARGPEDPAGVSRFTSQATPFRIHYDRGSLYLGSRWRIGVPPIMGPWAFSLQEVLDTAVKKEQGAVSGALGRYRDLLKFMGGPDGG